MMKSKNFNIDLYLNEKENGHENIGETNLYSNFFHMLTKAYILCTCKRPNLSKTVVVLHHHVCKDLLSQKML